MITTKTASANDGQFTAEKIGSDTGLDISTANIHGVDYYGYFNHSPLEDRLKKNFNYRPVKDPAKKTYMAHWMVCNTQLLLGYVNGIINGKRFYTTDIIPEFPEAEILHFYTDFSGTIKFYIPRKKPRTLLEYFLKKHCDTMSLSFESGILIKVNPALSPAQ